MQGSLLRGKIFLMAIFIPAFCAACRRFCVAAVAEIPPAAGRFRKAAARGAGNSLPLRSWEVLI